MNNKSDNLFPDLIKKVDKCRTELEIGYEDDEINKIWSDVMRCLRDVVDKALHEIIEHNGKLENEVKDLINEINVLHMELNGQVYEESLHEDVLLKKRKNVLLHIVEPLRKDRDLRTVYFTSLRHEERILSDMLGRNPIYLVMSDIPNKDELENYELFLKQLKTEVAERSFKVRQLSNRIIDISDEIGQPVELNIDTKPLSNKYWEYLQELHTQLCHEKRKQMRRANDLLVKLNKLWNRMEFDANEKERFLNEHKGCSQTAILALQEAVAKYEQLAEQHLSDYIQTLRDRAEQLWNKCKLNYSEQLRYDLPLRNSPREQAVIDYEVCIEQCRKYYEDNKSIFELMEKRDLFYMQYVELKHVSSNPRRLFDNRGAKLLQEENEFKRIKAELCKIDKELIQLINSYEIINKEPFRFWGRPLKDVLEEMPVSKDVISKHNTPQKSATGRRQLNQCSKTPLTPINNIHVTKMKVPKSAPEVRQLREPVMPNLCARRSMKVIKATDTLDDTELKVPSDKTEMKPLLRTPTFRIIDRKT